MHLSRLGNIVTLLRGTRHPGNSAGDVLAREWEHFGTVCEFPDGGLDCWGCGRISVYGVRRARGSAVTGRFNPRYRSWHVPARWRYD